MSTIKSNSKNNSKANIKLEKNTHSIFVTIIKSILYGYLFTIITFIIYGALLTYTQLTEKNIQLVVMITTVISVIISGFITSRGVEKRGLIFGMLAGAIYSIINIMITICILPIVTFTLKTALIIILSLFGGGIGGIIGINTKR